MKNFLSSVANFVAEEEAATAVEYAILVAAIATVIVVITLIVGAQVENSFNRLCKLLGGINGAKAC
ncbi:hypothetical protein FGKAn22_14740 [Ferrigenium kumadai]|uniref:Flp family type IVb pilin n=1 Tax=Ferrigenium kumadai TaxID=1682490 RepID=A0AAN1T010_9PROT|nr:Flp family type IVb pilin [Ferrigenium kumadai]BBI99781.1 hypothetical protein FGKAn22_14740 [Ferrigenium kumadai]